MKLLINLQKLLLIFLIKPLVLKYILSIWQLLWDTAETGAFYRALVPEVSLKIKFSDSNRAMETTLTRLRFNHNNLKANRYRVNCSDSPMCETCQVEESASHFLFDCIKYIDLQQDMFHAFRNHKIAYTINNMLGEHRIGAILTFQYITDTGRFDSFKDV